MTDPVAMKVAASLRRGLEAMALYASVPMDLWDRFSNDVLKAADLLETPTPAAGTEGFMVGIGQSQDRSDTANNPSPSES
jgi:hypothetical protein